MHAHIPWNQIGVQIIFNAEVHEQNFGGGGEVEGV